MTAWACETCLFLVVIDLQVVHAGALAQLLDGMFPDLAHTFAGKSEDVADFLVAVNGAPDAEDELEHGDLALLEHGLHQPLQLGVERFGLEVPVHAFAVLVGRHVDEGAAVLVAERFVEARVASAGTLEFDDLLLVDAQLLGYLVGGGRTSLGQLDAVGDAANGTQQGVLVVGRFKQI